MTRSLHTMQICQKKFCKEYILIATTLINQMPMKKLNWMSPDRLLFSKNPSYDDLRVFSWLCFDSIVYSLRNKFDNRGKRRVFL